MGSRLQRLWTTDQAWVGTTQKVDISSTASQCVFRKIDHAAWSHKHCEPRERFRVWFAHPCEEEDCYVWFDDISNPTKDMANAVVKLFVKEVHRKLERARKRGDAPPSMKRLRTSDGCIVAKDSSSSVEERLQRLKKLHDDGLLTLITYEEHIRAILKEAVWDRSVGG